MSLGTLTTRSGTRAARRQIVREWLEGFSVVCEHPDSEKDETYPESRGQRTRR